MNDMDSNRAWIMPENQECSLHHQKQTLLTLHDRAALQECGFLDIPPHLGNDFGAFAVGENEFATMMGDLACFLVAHRHRRVLYMTIGCPGRMSRLPLGGEVVERLAG